MSQVSGLLDYRLKDGYCAVAVAAGPASQSERMDSMLALWKSREVEEMRYCVSWGSDCMDFESGRQYKVDVLTFEAAGCTWCQWLGGNVGHSQHVPDPIRVFLAEEASFPCEHASLAQLVQPGCKQEVYSLQIAYYLPLSWTGQVMQQWLRQKICGLFDMLDLIQPCSQAFEQQDLQVLSEGWSPETQDQAVVVVVYAGNAVQIEMHPPLSRSIHPGCVNGTSICLRLEGPWMAVSILLIVPL